MSSFKKTVISVFALALVMLGFTFKAAVHHWDKTSTAPSTVQFHQELKDPKPAKTYVRDNSMANGILLDYNKRYNTGQSLKGDPNDLGTITEFWQAAAMIDWYLRPPLAYSCKSKVKKGNWHICQDAPYTVQTPCLVYSFGINWDFSFDDAMDQLGCEVHSFDPSMLNETDHKRGQNVNFHKLGLGDKDTNEFDARKDIYVKKSQNWNVKTLQTIMENLGHQNRVIDVLKIDVEGYEWNITHNLLETHVLHHVRQLLIEFHLMETWPLWSEYVDAYRALTALREMGFLEFSLSLHTRILKPKTIRIQGDNEYVNKFFERQPGWH